MRAAVSRRADVDFAAVCEEHLDGVFAYLVYLTGNRTVAEDLAAETFERALRRFKRAVEKTGLLTELRAREFYEKPTAERKRKHAAAVKRRYKRMRAQMLPPKLY